MTDRLAPFVARAQARNGYLPGEFRRVVMAADLAAWVESLPTERTT